MLVNYSLRFLCLSFCVYHFLIYIYLVQFMFDHACILYMHHFGCYLLSWSNHSERSLFSIYSNRIGIKVISEGDSPDGISKYISAQSASTSKTRGCSASHHQCHHFQIRGNLFSILSNGVVDVSNQKPLSRNWEIWSCRIY